MEAGEIGLGRLPPPRALLPVGWGYRCTRNREAAIDPPQNMAGKTAAVYPHRKLRKHAVLMSPVLKKVRNSGI